LPHVILVTVSEHSVVLKEVSVPLWQNSACEKALRQQFGSRFSLPDTSICAGADGRDACDVCIQFTSLQEVTG
jgi:secreted trypsin-like serine protease